MTTLTPRNVSRRTVLAAGAAAAAGTLAPGAFAQSPKVKPNLVFILADDMGYADLGCFGSRHIRTPELDSLAAQGVRMTDAYANSSVCSPTRLALVTGRYQQRLRTGLVEPFNPGPWGESAIPSGHATLPGELRKAGYATALVGKWHLGPTPAGSPLAHGYDTHYGFMGGTIDYFTHANRSAKTALVRNDQPITEPGYLTTLLGNEAVRVVERHAAARRPFLLSLHFNAPHWPWEGPEDFALGTKASHFDGGTLKTYAAMVESLDSNIGRVIRAIDNLGLRDDTLIVFTSDNGGERFSEAWPFRGMKALLLEGGIRVPAIVRYPALLPGGVVSAQQALTMDWMPTFLEAAGVPRADWPALDGMSLLATLATRQTLGRDLFWKFQGHRQRAVRSGRWKYYRIDEQEFLFDLSVDSLERANRAKAEPEVFERLRSAWREWNSGMVSDDSVPGECFSPSELAEPIDAGPGTNCKTARAGAE